jgi:hypothetical protein
MATWTRHERQLAVWPNAAQSAVIDIDEPCSAVWSDSDCERSTVLDIELGDIALNRDVRDSVCPKLSEPKGAVDARCDRDRPAVGGRERELVEHASRSDAPEATRQLARECNLISPPNVR